MTQAKLAAAKLLGRAAKAVGTATMSLLPRGAPAASKAVARKLPVAKPVPGAPYQVPMRDTMGAPITSGGPKPSSLAQLVHRMQDTGGQYAGKGYPKGTPAAVPSRGLPGPRSTGVHPDVDPAFAPAPRGFARTPSLRATPAQLAGVRRAEWRANNLPPWAARAYGAVTGAFKGASSSQLTEPGPIPMAKTNSHDAFRLGCYAAAKHAGATHDEAIAFVADLDRQALQQDASRLGAFKVAKDHGATDEQAVAFVKEAFNAVGAGQMVAGLGKKIFGGLGKAVGGFAQGMVGPTKGMSAAQTKGLQGLEGSISRARNPARIAELKKRLGQYQANLGKGGIGKDPNTGALGQSVNWMNKNPGLTGAGTVGAGYGAYRRGKSDEGGGAAAGKGGGGPGPGGMSPYDIQILRLLMSQQGGGGDNPWLHAGAMPYYPQ